MIKVITASAFMLLSAYSYSAPKIIYLECPNLDERAKDLVVVLDQPNGTASLQTSFGGEGLNYTAPASFGPSKVTWSKKSKLFNSTYSVDRASLALERKTFSEMTSNTYSEKTDCNIIKSPKENKF
ncbi:TPA: hypothetical protein HNV44_18290 [Escherichia coli]|nr:hypothetical protein [Escherichia coli]